MKNGLGLNVTLDYHNPIQDHPPHNRGARWQLFVLIATVTVIVAGAALLLFLPTLGRARETSRRIMCGNSLRQISLAANLYARRNSGAFPPDLIVLYQNEDITAELFTCPSSEINKAEGNTEKEIVESMLAGGHFSYAWTAGGLTTASPGDVILAFDLDVHIPRDNASTTGMNVLFADGRVVFVNESDAKAIHAQFAAGIRPIRLPATSPLAPPTQGR